MKTEHEGRDKQQKLKQRLWKICTTVMITDDHLILMLADDGDVDRDDDDYDEEQRRARSK